jgi:hypothetical protein
VELPLIGTWIMAFKLIGVDRSSPAHLLHGNGVPQIQLIFFLSLSSLSFSFCTRISRHLN